MTRRTLLKLAAFSAASSACAVGAGRQRARRGLRVTTHTVPWGLPRRVRVARLTDLHVGFGTAASVLDAAVLRCREASPDLVVLTGDYVNRTTVYLPELRKLLARLPRPCVATLGNHDHWSDGSAVREALAAEGVDVLSNAHTRLRLGGEHLTVVGVDDGHTGHADPKRAFSDGVAAHGGRLVLAGHTHGGQFDLGSVTDAMLRAAGEPYAAGWYDLDRTRLYVNAGVGGAVIGTRLGPRATPEVALFDLT